VHTGATAYGKIMWIGSGLRRVTDEGECNTRSTWQTSIIYILPECLIG
jgi:hypothetical protein